jgi:hypothetical protein
MLKDIDNFVRVLTVHDCLLARLELLEQRVKSMLLPCVYRQKYAPLVLGSAKLADFLYLLRPPISSRHSYIMHMYRVCTPRGTFEECEKFRLLRV